MNVRDFLIRNVTIVAIGSGLAFAFQVVRVVFFELPEAGFTEYHHARAAAEEDPETASAIRRAMTDGVLSHGEYLRAMNAHDKRVVAKSKQDTRDRLLRAVSDPDQIPARLEEVE
jgi:endonuclease IV